MLDVIIVIAFFLAGIGVGFYGIELLPPTTLSQVTNIGGLRWVMAGFSGLVGGVLGLMVQTGYRRLVARIQAMPVDILLSRTAGLVIGLLVANLMLAPLFLLPIPREFFFIKPLAAIVGSVIFGVSGMSLGDIQGRALLRLINPHSVETLLVAEGTLKPAATKVLDTSCIIDGRIEALPGTGFLEGQLLVPQFVLAELQQIADAADEQRRVRGRRGLDVLNRMTAAYPGRLVIHSADYEDVATVDAKLLRLALDINGTLVTHDYNLGKVASLQKVPVLNINDLVQVLRPIYLPGDRLELKIIKEGKEPHQGIGYLNDGTMVVVEEAEGAIGHELVVVVTGALQTSAGRMIFGRPEAGVPSPVKGRP